MNFLKKEYFWPSHLLAKSSSFMLSVLVKILVRAC